MTHVEKPSLASDQHPEQHEVLKSGPFADFLKKVEAYRADPKLRQDFAELEQSGRAAELREKLRSQPPEKLFALFANPTFAKDGVRIRFDFADMKNVQRFLGAAHILPAFIHGFQDVRDKPVKRGVTSYRGKGNKYFSIFSGTEIFVPYQEIITMKDPKKLPETEKKYQALTEKVRGNAGFERNKLAGEIAPKQSPNPAPEFISRPSEKREVRESYDPNEVVVLGDSQVGGLRPHLKNISCFFKNGGTISDVFNIAKRNVQNLAVKSLIYVQAGGNDVWNGNLKKMQNDMSKLLAFVRKVAPNARIVLGTIPPRQERIDRIKNPIQRVAVEECLADYNDWVRSQSETFDINHIVSSSSDTSQFPKQKDGVHLKPAGYEALAEKFYDKFPIQRPV